MKRSSASTSIRRVSRARCSSGLQRLAEGAALDLLAQPAPLLVRGDVLELVGDRAAVGLAQLREGLGQRRRPGRRCAAASSGIWAISSGRQADRLRVERRVARAASSRAGRATPRGGRGCAASARARSRSPRPGAAPRSARPAGAPSGARRRRRPRRAAARARRRAPRRRPRRSRPRRRAARRSRARKRPDSRALDHAVVVGRGQRHDLLGADLLADLAEPGG